MVGITASPVFVFRSIETVPQLLLTPNDLTPLDLRDNNITGICTLVGGQINLNLK